MTDTPRTDKAAVEGCELGSTFGSYFVPVELSRELERELAELQDRIKRLIEDAI